MSKAIVRLLRAAGFQPVSFASAEELLQTEAVDSAACLVLDIHLPGLSGLELGRLLVTSVAQNRSFSSPDRTKRPCATKRGDSDAPIFASPSRAENLLAAIRAAVTVESRAHLEEKTALRQRETAVRSDECRGSREQ